MSSNDEGCPSLTSIYEFFNCISNDVHITTYNIKVLYNVKIACTISSQIIPVYHKDIKQPLDMLVDVINKRRKHKI